MKDSGKDGLAEVSCMQSIVDNMKSKTRILVASVRSANEVADLAGMRREQEELAAILFSHCGLCAERAPM